MERVEELSVGLSLPLLLSTVTIFVTLVLVGVGGLEVMDLGRRVSYSESSVVEEVLVVAVLMPSPLGMLFTVTVSVV